MTNKDLTTAKPGDTVKTVAGTVFIIEEINGSRFKYCGYKTEFHYDCLEKGSYWGIDHEISPHPFDIAEIIPAPEPEPVNEIEALAKCMAGCVSFSEQQLKYLIETYVKFANEIIRQAKPAEK